MSAPASGASEVLRRFIPKWRMPAMFPIAVLLLLIAAVVAMVQEPRPDALAPVTMRSPDWWLKPIERNAFMRLPLVGTSLVDVCVLPGTGHVWVATDDYRILHSTDRGITWEVLEVKSAPGSPPPFVIDLKLAPPDPRGNLLDRVFFTSVMDGWAASLNGSIYVTHDGGHTWRSVLHLTGTAFPRRDRVFSARRAWIVADDIVVMTSDGGETWSTVTVKGALSCALLPDGSGWVATEQGEIYRVADDHRVDRLYVSKGLSIRSLSFNDARNGSFVADNGVWRTTDGGLSWQLSRRVNAVPNIEWVASRDGNLVIVARDNLVLMTGRGAARAPRSIEGSLDVLVGDEQFAVALLGNVLIATSDAGSSWRMLTLHSGYTEVIAADRDGDAVWAAGRAGPLLVSRNDGVTWRTIRSPISTAITAVHVVDPDTVLIGGEHALFRTTDGGKSWKPTGKLPFDPKRIFASGTTILAVDSDGENASRSDDDGKSWIRVSKGGAIFVDALRGWTSEEPLRTLLEKPGPGRVLTTSDGGRTWSPVHTFGGYPIVIAVSDDLRRAIVADIAPETVPYRTLDGGKTWRALPINSRFIDARSFGFSRDLSRGWSRSDNLLATSFDGGTTWQRQVTLPNATPEPETMTFAADGEYGWAASVTGVPLRTKNGGETWLAPEYARYPAPWFWLALVPLAGLIYASTRPAKVDAQDAATIGDVPANDRALVRPSEDVLDFASTANGIARFLGNRRTEPPITIAITGAWGTGKSSMMNLVVDGVRRYGHRPVTFNAWHYQTEEHLLPAIMESIRREAVPEWWRLSGLLFRIRLLVIRGLANWLPAVFIATLLTAGIAYFAADGDALKSVIDLATNIVKGDPSSLSAQKAATPLAIVVGMLIAAGAVFRTLNAFGVSGSRIASFFAGGVRLSELAGQTGFRHQFAAAFREVTTALGRRNRIVLAIDDLDRCRPEHVLNILETMNFLISCGDCFVLVAMDRHRVERCVAMRFVDEAKEIGSDLNNDGIPDDMTAGQYAHLYMEKLLNLEVPVPAATEEASKRFFAGRTTDTGRRVQVTPIGQGIGETAAGLAIAASIAAVIVYGGWFGYNTLPLMHHGDKHPAPAIAASVVAPPAQTSTASVQPPRTAAPPKAPPRAASSSEKLIVAPAPGIPFGWIATSILGLIALGIGRLSIDATQSESDSKPFRVALGEWHPLLYVAEATPRSMKRCINRVRYYAMRQRSNPLPQRTTERVARWVQRKQSVAVAPLKIREDILVALGVMQHVYPKWLEDDSFWDAPGPFLAAKELPPRLQAAVADLGGIGHLRDEFERISAGVYVAGVDVRLTPGKTAAAD